jgi:hypothetical protein
MLEVDDKQRRLASAAQSARNQTHNNFASIVKQIQKRSKREAYGGSCDSCCIPGHTGRQGPPGKREIKTSILIHSGSPGTPGTPGAPGRPGS